MEKSAHSDDKLRLRTDSDKLAKFNKLIRGHRKLLMAIGEL
jgi:hypothetical protein